MLDRQAGIAQALAELDAWLQTMRQAGGYGGPVAHWWQNRYRYAGPGLDWRYEGLLSGYAVLRSKTAQPKWCTRLHCAAEDVRAGQLAEGSYSASRFELNPGDLGTPHEAAATLGLLRAAGHLGDREALLGVAKRNLDNLIAKLWDGGGFNDRPGVPGRVPNKLATLAQALMSYAEASGEEDYLPYAKAALEDTLRFQVAGGRWRGAIHQYAADTRRGDGRFFPYYAARCVPALVQASTLFHDLRYRRAAEQILAFLEATRAADGSWPQVVYRVGRADWPRWLAGSADILLAYVSLSELLPEAALERLLESQHPNGSFPTAQGFSSQLGQGAPGPVPDYRDVTPVVGWNDKVLRLLAELLVPGSTVPEAEVREFTTSVSVEGVPATFYESAHSMSIYSLRGEVFYAWAKDKPWAQTVSAEVDIR